MAEVGDCDSVKEGQQAEPKKKSEGVISVGSGNRFIMKRLNSSTRALKGFRKERLIVSGDEARSSRVKWKSAASGIQ
jgi:hypothetical protein